MLRTGMIKDSRSCDRKQIPMSCHWLSVLFKDQDNMATWSSLWSSDFCTWLWQMVPSKQGMCFFSAYFCEPTVNENLLPELHHRRCSIHRSSGQVCLSIVGVDHQTRFWNQPKWWRLKPLFHQKSIDIRHIGCDGRKGYKLPVFHVLLQVAQGSVAEKEENR